MNIIKVKQPNGKFTMTLIVLGFILMIFGNIIGIGTGLYLWLGTEMAFGLVVWAGFKIWIVMVGSGFLLFLAGVLS